MSNSIQMMNADQAKKYIDSHKPDTFTLLDVRQDWEYEEFHIPGANLISLPELPDRLNEVTKEKPVLVYCAAGGRSMAAAALMEGQGYGEIINLVGGAMGWNSDVAFGPMELGMIEFTGKESPVEIVLKAYAMENSLQRFYFEQAEKADTPERADLFRQLAGFEDKHKDTLFRIYKRVVDGDVPREAFEEVAFESVEFAAEGGVEIQEFIKDHADAFDTEDGVLQVAAMVEAQALDYYLRCAMRAENAETEELLQLLAREEKAHLKLLGKFMDKRKG